MATVSQLRSGLATRLDTISGAHCYSYEPDVPIAPALIVASYTADYDLVMGAGTNYDFEVLVILGRQVDRSFQEQIDSYLQPTGSTSIKAAVEGDQTLGGVASYAAVRNVSSSLSSMDFAGVTYAVATVRVEVVAQP